MNCSFATPEQMKECVEGTDIQPVFFEAATVSETMFQRAIGKMKGWLAQEEEGTQARAKEYSSGDSRVLLGRFGAGRGARVHFFRYQSRAGAYIVLKPWYPGTDHSALIFPKSDPGVKEGMARRLPTASIVYRASDRHGSDGVAVESCFRQPPGGGESPDVPGSHSGFAGR